MDIEPRGSRDFRGKSSKESKGKDSKDERKRDKHKEHKDKSSKKKSSKKEGKHHHSKESKKHSAKEGSKKSRKRSRDSDSSDSESKPPRDLDERRELKQPRVIDPSQDPPSPVATAPLPASFQKAPTATTGCVPSTAKPRPVQGPARPPGWGGASSTPASKHHPVSKFDREKDTQCFQLEPLIFLSLRHYTEVDSGVRWGRAFKPRGSRAFECDG